MSQQRRGRGRKTRPRGSVYWHAASERWCAQTPPDRRGRRRSKYFAADHEDGAWAWLDDQLAALDDGLDLAAGSERLSAYLNRWLKREAANLERDWSASTKRTYTWAVERIAGHALARTAVGDLTRDHTDTMLADLADELQRRSIALVRSLLRSTLADLEDDGIINRNPVRRARTARHLIAPEPNRCPWTEDEVRRFLATANEHSKRPALWWLIASCGLRSAETRSLMLSDLDLDSGTLTVWRSKTRKRQTLDLPTNVIAALREHLQHRRALGGPLFQAQPGRHMSGPTLLNELRQLRVQAGVPPIGRVHDLRHIAGSLMLANGYPVPTVAMILGHSPKTLLTTYAHAIPRHVIQAPRNIAEVLPYPIAGARQPSAITASAVHPAVLYPAHHSGTTADLALTTR